MGSLPTGGTFEPRKSSMLRKTVVYWSTDLRINAFIEAQLILLTFATGIQDAISYPDFRCFASNQTGNTVVLAVALAGHIHDLFDPANVGTSLTTFLAGAIVTGHLGTAVGKRNRFWQFGVNAVQVCMVFGAAWIQYVHGDQERGNWARAALALIALSSGSQVAAARAMSIPEIPTAMATAAWVDLLIDDGILMRRNRSRDRRVLFLAALIAGSFAGAFMRAQLGSPLALVVSAIGKALVPIAILFTGGEVRS